MICLFPFPLYRCESLPQRLNRLQELPYLVPTEKPLGRHHTGSIPALGTYYERTYAFRGESFFPVD